MRPKYTDGYEIRYNSNTDQFECWKQDTLLAKKDGKPASYKAEALAVKFMVASGAQVATPEIKLSWTPPEPAKIAPLAEQLAALPADRFVLIEAGYGTYKEQGYACYDREEQEIVSAHCYNGWNDVTRKREEAEAEVAYRLEHGVEKVEVDLYLFNEIFGEQIRRSGDYQPEIQPRSKEEANYNRQKAYWEARKAEQSKIQTAPQTAAPAETTFVTDRKYVVGETFTNSNHAYTVIEESFHLSQKEVDEAEEGFDVFGLQAGWQTKAKRID